MKMRLKLNERGELVARDGQVIGVLESITVSLDTGAITRARSDVTNLEITDKQPLNSLIDPPSVGSQATATGTATPLFASTEPEPPSPMQQVWHHYQATVDGASRRKLDSARQTCIKRALQARTVAECCSAIDGLAASPHHNGLNDRETKYLDIQYALGLKSESADARIDKMGSRTAESVQVTSMQEVVGRLPSEIRAITSELMTDVVEMYAYPSNEHAQRRGSEALRKLREAPRVRVEPVLDGRRVVGWRKVDGSSEGVG